MTLIVVSNRIARPRSDEAINGGLAAALLPAVKESGAIWVGASNRLSESQHKEPLAEIEPLGCGALATVDLPAQHYRRYYEGFSNSALWPALHSRTDLIRARVEDYASYREINAFMARALMRFTTPDAVFWVHDYQLLTLGEELRGLGVRRPIGFFLHTPFPARGVFASLPNHQELARALLSYDLVGFQTSDDCANFVDYVERELGLKPLADRFLADGRATKVASFPIGIDARAFAERATKAVARPEVSRLRASLQGAKLAIGVDRLDYSKGLPNRFRAMDRLFELYPHFKRQLSLLQIAVPTRGQISAYKELRTELAGLGGEVNGRHGDVDWTPIRYINHGYAQSTLAGFYRTAQIGLITPLIDGMNLVAKEYVATQNPLDPGVLVLSQFAGAAKQLDAAVLVNPHDVDGMAHAVAQAMVMPAQERRERWNAMMARLEEFDLDAWFSDFVITLEECWRAAPAIATEPAIAARAIAAPARPRPVLRRREFAISH